MRFDSKLPDVGTTIFTIMSRRAIEEGALNIGQGFPDYPIDPRLAQSLVEAVSAGHNQYAPMEGVIALRELIAAKLAASYGISVDPSSEITVTCGATEALYDAIQAVIGPGDEAMIFDPAYDAYEPAVRLAGGRCVRIPLLPPTFAFDWDRIHESLTPRTRLVIVNSPQNPSCTIASRADLDALAAVVRDRPISILADEVYESVVFDGRRHASVLAHPELRERSFAVFSFGKALHATGWRTGYCVAPPAAHARVAQGASIQHLQHCSAFAARDRRISHALPRCLERFVGVFRAQARSSHRVLARLGSSRPCAPREPIFCWSITARSAVRPISISATG